MAAAAMRILCAVRRRMQVGRVAGGGRSCERVSYYHPPDFGGDAGALGGAALAGADIAGLVVAGPSPSDFFSGHPVSKRIAWADNTRAASVLFMGKEHRIRPARDTTVARP